MMKNARKRPNKNYIDKAVANDFLQPSKKMDLKGNQVQPKLSVGASNDTYEKEADNMADRIMTKSNTIPSIQRKCTKCEEEEKLQKKEIPEVNGVLQPKFLSGEEQDNETIQTKSQSSSPTIPPSFQHKLSGTKGQGKPLPQATNAFMSTSFGNDFSDVKVHNNSHANQMNEQINARAFTHGNDIYFKQGEYNTGSSKGKHLLAHELTHVIQQKGEKKIQRATDTAFRVDDKFPGAARDDDSIYFDFDSAHVDSAEESKLDAFASNATQPYDLIGFASEEGSNEVNRRLTNRRLNSVDRVMADKGHTAARNKKNQFAKGNNKLQYRRLRRVDILNAGTVSQEPDCTVSPVVSCGTSFSSAHPVALSQVISAYVKMVMAPLDPVEFIRVSNAITALFGDISNYDTIKNNLIKLLVQIGDQPNTVTCHNSCDNTCRPNIYGYMDGSTGPGAVLTLCALFFNETNTDTNARRLIHEALHATPGVETDDLSYYFERGIFQLSPSDALKNTDSYVLLIKELNNPGSVIGSGGNTRDVIDTAITGTELTDLRRVMAYLEKWLIESNAELSSTYATLVEVRDSGTWTGAHGYYKDTMSFLAPLFGLRAPNTVPLEPDQVAVAGIYDRIRHMTRFLVGKDIVINKDPGAVRFGSGPSEPLLVNDLFLASGQHSMVYTLIHKIVEANSRISSAHKQKYVDLIEFIRNHSGQPAP